MSKKIHINHTTVYQYSEEVTLGDHIALLRPRDDGMLHVLGYSLSVHPVPLLHRPFIDCCGNSAQFLRFGSKTRSLAFVSSFTAVCTRDKSLSERILEERMPGPFVGYSPAECEVLAPWRSVGTPDPVITAFAVSCGAQSEPLPIFLKTLSQRLSRFTAEIRDDGAPRPTAQTITLQQGTCRDLTTAFVEVVRTCGLAARFTSGYWLGAGHMSKRELHAWADVYVDGLGWAGFDPVEGGLIGDAHVPLAVAAHGTQMAPIMGTWIGTGESSMEWTIEMKAQ